MSRRPYLLAPLVALVAGLTLTGCGNNGVAVQSNEHTVDSGVDGRVGSVLLRNAQLTVAGDGSGLLAVALFNQGQDPDALLGLTSDQAAGFTLPAGATAVSGAYGGVSPSVTVTVAGSPPAAAGSAPAVGSIALPAQTGVYLNSGLTQITVTGLPLTAVVGQSIPVSFVFQGAGSITLQVPITESVPQEGSPTVLPSVGDAGVAGGPTSTAPATSLSATPPSP